MIMTVAEPATDQLSDFTADPHGFIERLRESGQPTFLTHDGQPACVVLDVASFERMMDRIERLDTIAIVRQSLRDSAEGKTRPLRECMEEITKKYKLSPLPES
jgi:PHD/YefM family antitoxin component YafN of YafNO toxin-antitoxin module